MTGSTQAAGLLPRLACAAVTSCPAASRRAWVLAILTGFFATGAFAHDVITTKITWSREVSRIVQKHCVSCHRNGGSAFSLTAYADARPWAKAIKEEVLERRMPPWGAVKGFGSFRDDQGLTQEDLEVIAAWVEGGAPEGDPKLLPKHEAAAPAVPATAATGEQKVVRGSEKLKAPVVLTAIKPGQMREGSSVKIIAKRPDGTVTPLLWLYHFNGKFNHAYKFRQGVALPAGSEIITAPADAGPVVLFTKPALTSALKPAR